MKTIHTVCLSVSLILFIVPLIAQNEKAGLPMRSEQGVFGAYSFENGEPLSAERRMWIRQRLDAVKDSLLIAGLRQKPSTGTKSPLFITPLRQASGLTDPGFCSISGYVDQNPASGQVLDYSCGNLSYDLPGGYNHQGTDFYSWPFGWFKMEFDEVEVVAAADGVILYKEDGHYDRNCSMSTATWNAIYIEHSDGSEAWYGHLKNGSLTAKGVGQTVTAGEYLGIMGSSGSSTGPHLHFEVYDQFGHLIDPFYGTCNYLNGISWWQSQEEYRHQAINLVATHHSPPWFPPCPETEFPNRSDHFNAGDTVYLAAYFKNLFPGDLVRFQVYRPNSSLWDEWSWESNWPFYTSAYLYYWMAPGMAAMTGQWKLRVIYEGISYDHDFFYGVSGINNPDPGEPLVYPQPAGDELKLSPGADMTGEYRWILSECTGRQMMSGIWNTSAELNIPVHKVPGGLYTLQLHGEGNISTTKILIIH